MLAMCRDDADLPRVIAVKVINTFVRDNFADASLASRTWKTPVSRHQYAALRLHSLVTSANAVHRPPKCCHRRIQMVDLGLLVIQTNKDLALRTGQRIDGSLVSRC